MSADDVAAEATLIERQDLGPDRFTVVAAGDAVPARLVDLPRVPRELEAKPRRKPARKR